MCDCIPSTLLPCSSIGIRIPCFTRFNWRRSTVPEQLFVLSPYKVGTRARYGWSKYFSNTFGSNVGNMDTDKLTTKSIEVGRNSSSSGSDEYELYAELGFKEKDENGIEIETGANDEEELNSTSTFKYGSDFIGFDDGYRRKSNTFSSKVKVKDDEDLIKIKIDDDDAGLRLKELEVRSSNLSMSGRGRRRRQMMNRSNMIAKQVISIQSAISLGFVSQLWVDTNSVSEFFSSFISQQIDSTRLLYWEKIL